MPLLDRPAGNISYQITGSGSPAVLLSHGFAATSRMFDGNVPAIAADYLYRSGTVTDSFATNEELLSIIVQLFERGEFNRIRLANKAIAKFEASENV